MKRLLETFLLAIIMAAGAQAQGNAEISTQGGLPDVQELMVDVAAVKACSVLSNQIMTLSTGGAAAEGGDAPAAGVLWINECSASEMDPRHVRMQIGGLGWVWIDRTTQQLGAGFEVSEYVAFRVETTMVGTFDIAYDTEEHILTAWLLPTQPLDVTMTVLTDVDVATEGLWSSIVGAGASIFGEAPGERAEEAIRKQAVRRFKSRLSKGATLIFDLCSGQRYTKLGTFPAGEIPENAIDPEGHVFLVNKRGVLHEGGLVMAGIFEPGKPLIAQLNAESGSVLASWYCREEAERLAKAYVEGQTLPEIAPLTQSMVPPGAVVDLTTTSNCPAVLVLQPLESAEGPVNVSYMVYRQGEQQQTLAPCGD